MGPTAAGKTAVALQLVADFPFQIVSVDSAMVYRRLDIGSGKPTCDELKRAPHRMIDIREPHEPYSAADFARDAKAEIQAIRHIGQLPLLVGGTGLYFRALEEGLSKLPSADAAVRADIAARATRDGWASLHTELARVDPKRASELHPNDAQRVQRALEIYYVSGVPPSAMQARKEGGVRGPTLKIIINPADRGELHRAIATRFDAMLAAGLVDEVRALRTDNRLTSELPSMRAVGYRQVCAYLDGEYDDATMREKGIAATRQLARRQLTWLRRIPDADWFNPLDATMYSQICARVHAFMKENLP